MPPSGALPHDATGGPALKACLYKNHNPDLVILQASGKNVRTPFGEKSARFGGNVMVHRTDIIGSGHGGQVKSGPDHLCRHETNGALQRKTKLSETCACS